MITVLRLTLALLLVFTTATTIPGSANGQAAPVPPLQPGSTQSVACYNFAVDLYYGMTIPPARIQQYRSAVANPAYAQYIAGVSKLQEVLGAEGYPIQSTEEKNKKFGKNTAIALVKYQIANKVAIGEEPSGIFSEKTRNVFNQKYGCISKATINLTAPNTKAILAKGEIVPIKWTAAKIPNTTDLTIQYVKDNNTATTTVTIQSNVRNGNGQYNWTVPSTITPGNYKILVSLTGVSKSDVSAKTFEIREKALEIVSPVAEVKVTAGNKLPITWKTSTAIKPSDKIKVTLVGTLVSNGSSSTSVELARVVNNGAYTWTVPERINNKIVTGTSTFNIVLQSEVGAHTSTSTSSVIITPVPAVASVPSPKITVWNIMGQAVRGNPIIVNWTTNTSFGNSARVYAKLMRINGTLETEAARSPIVTPYTNSTTIAIPTNTTPSATATTNDYKVVLVVTGLTSGVSLDATSDIVTDGFSVITQGVNSILSAKTDKESFAATKGSPVTVQFSGTVPASTRLTLNLMKADGTAVSGVSSVSTSMSAKQVKFNIPTTLAVGQYKIGVSGVVDTNLVSTTTPAFEVSLPYVRFIDSASQNGITKTNGQNGSTTALSAVFEMQVIANGGIFTKPLPSNLKVVFENTVTGATFSPNSVKVTGSNIAKDSGGSFIILATLDTSKFASNTTGTYRAKIVNMTYTFNGGVNAKTEGLSAYVTPTTTLVR